MKSIAFFNIPAYGHIRPTLPIVEQLVEQGCRVLYFIVEEYREAVEATGAEVRIVPNYTGAPQIVPKTGIGIAAKLAEQAYRTLPLLLEDVAKEDIGVIVHDSFCIWGMCVARLTGIPSVRTCSALAGSAPIPTRWKAAAGLLWFLRNEFNLSDWLRFRKYRGKLSREFGLPRGRFELTAADRSIVFTSRELIPDSPWLDDRTTCIGASFSDTGASDFQVPEPGDRPLVFISLGSTFTNEPAFFQLCKEAFGSADAVVVMSIGNQVDPKRLEPWPENFTVAPFVPQLEILRKATVFVTHAGCCSLMEGLWHKVPLVMVPLTNEHAMNAKLVEPTRAGIILNKDELTAQRLRDVALSVAEDPAIREGAVRIGETMRAAGGPARGADVILEFHPAAKPI